MDIKTVVNGIDGLDDSVKESLTSTLTSEFEKISKERDQATHARNRVNDDLKDLKKQVEELRQAKEELESKDMSDSDKTKKQLEKLQSNLDALAKERDEAQSLLERTQRDNTIAKIHGDVKWNRDLIPTDDSLALVSRVLDGVDLSDDGAVKEAVQGALKDRSHYVLADANGGTGSHKAKEGQATPQASGMTADKALGLRGKDLVENLDAAWAAVSQAGEE